MRMNKEVRRSGDSDTQAQAALIGATANHLEKTRENTKRVQRQLEHASVMSNDHQYG